VSDEDVDEELEEAGETLSGLPAVFVPGVTHLWDNPISRRYSQTLRPGGSRVSHEDMRVNRVL
jgi:hypothetical protein